ncbi:arylsulfatase B-like [Glandiceps talaboti]
MKLDPHIRVRFAEVKMELVVKTHILFCVTLIALTVLCDAAKPNIVYILADDLGWSDVGFNNPSVISPNLNQLASEGVILDQYYVHPLCSPTRFALMTGYYAFRGGYQYKTINKYELRGLPSNTTTIAQELKALDYSTYMVGKWHLGYCNYSYTPHGRGFDKFYGLYLAHFDYTSHTNGGFLDLRENDVPDPGSDGIYSTGLFANKSVDYIMEHPKCTPMFMYLAFLAVHSPLGPPQEYLDLYPNVANEVRRKKMAMVTAMDDGIGRVVTALKSRGMWGNTIFIFASDNGGPQNDDNEGINFPLKGGKSTLWEGGTRSPSFVTSHLLKKTGYRNKQMLHVVDWFPTFINLAGGTLDPVRDHDGYDVWGAVSNDEPSPRNGFAYHINERDYQWAVRIAAKRLELMTAMLMLNDIANWSRPPPENDTIEAISYSNVNYHEVLLYNIADDPSETTDLAADMPEKRDELIEEYEKYMQKLMPSVDPETDYNNGFAGNWGNTYSHGWCNAS